MELASDSSRQFHSAAFVRNWTVLNIVIDKQIIVTNTCYIRVGSIVVLPNACFGKPFDFRGGGFRQIV